MSDAKDLTDALDAMMRSDRTDTNTLPALPVRGAQPRSIGAAAETPPTSSGGGGGTMTATGPFVETDFEAREFHAAKYWTTDGLFAFPAVKKIHMLDASGNNTTIELKSPT